MSIQLREVIGSTWLNRRVYKKGTGEEAVIVQIRYGKHCRPCDKLRLAFHQALIEVSASIFFEEYYSDVSWSDEFLEAKNKYGGSR